VSPEIRRCVEQAWFEQQPLRLDYRRSNFERTSGTVIVRGVIMERSMIVLECDDLEDGQPRTFRLDRIERAAVLSRERARPAKET
ncbi:MAG TPA: WYL domain-containing protein, partial [Polyangiaceae bacterium]|nr:WYL domain-containing protein [Polyangiaceae bacterium]